MSPRGMFFVLKGHEAVEATSREWSQFFDAAGGGVPVRSETFWDVRISTVFLGINHNWGEGPPLIFETMVFGGPCDGEQWRCSTWDQAVCQHAKAVARVIVSSVWSQ